MFDSLAGARGLELFSWAVVAAGRSDRVGKPAKRLSWRSYGARRRGERKEAESRNAPLLVAQASNHAPRWHR
jgi:hypothetical protein